MTKLTIFSWILTGSLAIYSDMPLHFLFGVVFVGIMIEIKKIEKKIYPIISNIVLSAVVGWGSTFGIKHFKPNWLVGDLKVFTIFVTTLFAYVTVIYLLKNETVQKWFSDKIKKS